jgi:hypothetical protein
MTYLGKKRTYDESVAIGLCPVRVDSKRNRFVYYSTVTWNHRASLNVDMWLRRLDAFGFLLAKCNDLALDVVDEDGSILETFGLTPAGFEYLRRNLRFRREPG